ncbi:hypothetical protein SDC9_191092 [bioreactor metagenome]|uniref:Uncharacterized protein n=1 Tax=bioreactor metagenome TaxID=1076179 RepID=A0A645HYG0_9ZZZZ
MKGDVTFSCKQIKLRGRYASNHFKILNCEWIAVDTTQTSKTANLTAVFCSCFLISLCPSTYSTTNMKICIFNIFSTCKHLIILFKNIAEKEIECYIVIASNLVLRLLVMGSRAICQDGATSLLFDFPLIAPYSRIHHIICNAEQLCNKLV